MCVNVQCMKDLDDGDSWRCSTLVKSSPQSSISVMRLTLTKPWSVYLAKTQTWLSYLNVGCIGRKWSARCRWSGEIRQCLATMSAVAWHDRRHIHQSRDQCAKHLAQWRFPRIMHWGSGPVETARCLFQQTIIVMISHRGYSCSVPASYALYQQEKSQSQTLAPNINEPVPACAAGQSVDYAVESARAAQVSRYHSVRLGDQGLRPSACYCLGWPRSTIPVMWFTVCVECRARKAALEYVAATKNIFRASHTATALVRTAAVLHTQTQKSLGWRRGWYRDGECWRQWFGGRATRGWRCRRKA